MQPSGCLGCSSAGLMLVPLPSSFLARVGTMGIDMFRVNALIDLLLWEGIDFDPEIACELFEMLPEERTSRFQFRLTREYDDNVVEGLTNIGTVSAGGEEEKTISFGRSTGTWIGKWRIIRTARGLVIEPRFLADISEDGRGEYFVLPFKRGKPQSLYKSALSRISIPIPFIGSIEFSFYRLVKWKSPAVPRHAGQVN